MGRRALDELPRNDFEILMAKKLIDSTFLASHWQKDVRRINQIRVNPKQLFIDALEGIPKRRTKKIRTVNNQPATKATFENIMLAKEVTVSYLSERWLLSISRINQIRRNPEILHIDAIKGIPKYCKKRTD